MQGEVNGFGTSGMRGAESRGEAKAEPAEETRKDERFGRH